MTNTMSYHVFEMYLSTSIFMLNAAIINVVTDDLYVTLFPQCSLCPLMDIEMMLLSSIEKHRYQFVKSQRHSIIIDKTEN